MPKLSYSELRKGVLFVLEGQPHEVLEYEFLRMQQRKPVAKTKLRNLITGKTTERTFHQNESFEEADIVRKPVKYLYTNRGESWFCPPENPQERFSLPADTIGSTLRFAKQNSEVTAVSYGDQIITIELPIKADLLVKDAPPGVRGDTAQGGSKQVTLETGAIILTPLFIDTGDLVRVNTQTGEYVERMEKAKS